MQTITLTLAHSHILSTLTRTEHTLVHSLTYAALSCTHSRCLVKAHSLVEIFNSIPSTLFTWPSELHGLLQILEGCGVEGARAFRLTTYNSHPSWCQTDGAACGIFASLIIASLVGGKRIRILQADVKAWRGFLRGEVVKKGNMPGTAGTPRTPPVHLAACTPCAHFVASLPAPCQMEERMPPPRCLMQNPRRVNSSSARALDGLC